MNKEIKYRAWLKDEKKMVEVREINFASEQILFETEDEFLYAFFDEIELLGYTGHKDTNGVEIFEGDIVQWCGNKMEIFWGEDIGCGYGFCWRNIKGDSYYHESMTGFIDEYEVIGNVYQNEELLENVD